MLKRRVGITTKTTAIIVAAIILVVAGGTSAYYLTLPTKPPPGGTVKVGFSISLTGSFNVEGAASLNGMKTATQWLNSNGGIIVNGKSYNMTLDYTDDASQTSNIVPLWTSGGLRKSTSSRASGCTRTTTATPSPTRRSPSCSRWPPGRSSSSSSP